MVKRGLILGGVLATFSVVSFSNNIYAAETGTTKFSVDLNQPVLELTVPANPAVINLEPVATGDSFGSTNIAIRVATNNITGYTLTMNPSNNVDNTSLIRTELLTEESTYRTIGTLAQTDPVSAGYTEQSFTANKWGYKITGDNYYGIDPNNTTVSHPAWVGNDPTNGTNHNLTLGVKINANTVSGSYETTLNFRAVTNAVVAKDTVTFNGNGADSGDMSSDIVVASYGTPEILPANKFSKNGYRFIGWNTKTDGTGLSYVDEGEYDPVSSDYNHNIVLYAMWSNLPPSGSTSGTTPGGNPGVTISRAYEIAYTAAGKGMWEQDVEDLDNDGDTTEYRQVSDGVYRGYDVRWDMQGMTSEICNSVTALHDDYQAMDIRDWKLYHITKMKDGKCWMTQNLDFEMSTNTSLSSLDTDLNQYDTVGYTTDAGYTKEGNTIYWAPATSTTHEFNSGTFSYYDLGNKRYARSFDPGNYYWIGNWNSDGAETYYEPTINDYVSGDMGSNPEKFSIVPFAGNGMHGHVGNYYNWAAAVATNHAERFVGNTASDVKNNPQNSICPHGWRLPTISNGGTTDDFVYLVSQYANISSSQRNKVMVSAPLWFVRTGRMSSNTLNIGYSTDYWSSTSYATSTYGYNYYQSYMCVSNITNSITSFSYRNEGVPVRCVAR